MGVVFRTQPGRAVRCAQLELIHAGYVEVLRHAVCGGIAIVDLRALLRPEERGFVPANDAVEDVAILDLERGHEERVLGPQLLRARCRYGREIGRVRRELRNVRHGERRGIHVDERIGLILVDVRDLGRVGEPVPGAEGSERGARVVRAVALGLLKKGALVLGSRRTEKPEGPEILVVLVGHVVIDVCFGRQPRERTIAGLERAGETVAIVVDRPL